MQNEITETSTWLALKARQAARCVTWLFRLAHHPRMKTLFVLLLLLCIVYARKYDRDMYNSQVELGVSSISAALSYVPLPLNETGIYNYTIPDGAQYGMITHWWLTGNHLFFKKIYFVQNSYAMTKF